MGFKNKAQISFSDHYLCCPLCGMMLLSLNEALRRLASAHRLSFDSGEKKLKQKLQELAAADVHRGVVLIEYPHFDLDNSPCSCLIVFEASGELAVANYAPAPV